MSPDFMDPIGALSIVGSPEHFTALQRQLAWRTLKEARGQTVDFRHIPGVHAGLEGQPPCPSPLVQRIHKRAAELGLPIGGKGGAA